MLVLWTWLFNEKDWLFPCGRGTPTNSGWWFGTFFIFPYIGNNHPNWLMFFRGVGKYTTNQFRLVNYSNLPSIMMLSGSEDLGCMDCAVSIRFKLQRFQTMTQWHVELWDGKVNWAVFKTPVGRGLQGIILPNLSGIVIIQYRNPKKTNQDSMEWERDFVSTAQLMDQLSFQTVLYPAW